MQINLILQPNFPIIDILNLESISNLQKKEEFKGILRIIF